MTHPFLVRAKEVIALSAHQFNQLCLLWSDIYAYYGQDLSDKRMAAYAEDCMQFAPTEVHTALVVWRRTARPTNQVPKPPMPADILAQLAPKVDLDAQASGIAGRILGAMRDHGYTHSGRAREHIGDAGWRVVQSCGGWSNLCECVHADNRSTYHAQFRDMARAELQAAQHGEMAQLRDAAAKQIAESRPRCAAPVEIASIARALAAKGI